LRLFADELIRYTSGPVPQFRDWLDAIPYMFSVAGDRAVPVVIDEFPSLVKASPGLPSIIQRELGPGGSGTASRVRLLLCGSAMSVMAGLLSGHAPLRGRAGLELIVPRAARRAAAVIAISEFGRQDMAAELGVPTDSIFVTPLAPAGQGPAAPVAEHELRRRLSLGESELVLCVSAALAHKNLPRLIDAFAPLTQERDAILVLAGHDGLERAALRAHADAAGIPDRVRLAGWIERAELEGLYNAARAFAYPSLIEGFGIPILEAMARGLPVACSSAGALAEVAGGAALLFDPHNTSAITETIRRLLDDAPLRERLIEAGWARAREFSWERCAEQTLAVYRHVLEGGHLRPER